MSTGALGGGFLVIKAKGGFGNRMLSATTGIALARIAGRTLVVDWRDGEYLPRGANPYPLLFADPVGIDASSFDTRTDVAPAVWSGRLASHPTDVISEFYPNGHTSPIVYRRLSIDLRRPEATTEPVAVFWSYLPKMMRLGRRLKRVPQYRGMTLNEVTRVVLEEHFTPNERVRSQVEAVFAELTRPTIGVHIRYTDRKVSLTRIAREVRRLRAQMPAAAIFLATDNSNVRNEFCRQFSNVHSIDKAFGDDDNSLHEGVVLDDPLTEAENALVDMWALARCDWLVHSRHSTFSVAAALIGGIPASRQRDVDRWNARVVAKRWIQNWA